jgi:hypothetical protein
MNIIMRLMAPLKWTFEEEPDNSDTPIHGGPLPRQRNKATARRVDREVLQNRRL